MECERAKHSGFPVPAASYCTRLFSPGSSIPYNASPLEWSNQLSESAASPARYALAVITDDEEIFPEIRKHLGSEFRTTLASDENAIRELLEQPNLHAILFNLDCIGDGPIDGLEVLTEIRRIRDDVVIVAFTRSNQRTIPLERQPGGRRRVLPFPHAL